MLKYLFCLLVIAGESSLFAKVSTKAYADTHLRLALTASDTLWDFYSTDDFTQPDQPESLELKFVARGPVLKGTGVQPSLTLRVDPGKWSSAKSYAEKWLREYPKFGYELQNSGESKYGQLSGYNIELTSNVSSRRVKQFLVQRPNEMWIFTCSSDQVNYQEVWKSCEKILGSAHNK